MRFDAACLAAVAVAAMGTALLPAQAQQQTAPRPATQAAAPAAQPAPADRPPAQAQPPAAASACANANALGVARVVEIDTTGGPGFGFEHFKAYDFLKPGEVVLTFDDGPWPANTPAVLAALAGQCTKATFFPIGKHAMYHPEILKQVLAAGHTIGSHTWSHADLSKLTTDQAKDEFEKGASAVSVALGGAGESSFFRFPALRHPPEMIAYMEQRNVAIFSTDLDSFDFKIHKPDQVIKSVMNKLKKNGKGIILMHDFQKSTAAAIAPLLAELKAGGYRVVHMKSKDMFKTMPEYDEALKKQLGGATANSRPLTSVVRTVE